MKITLSKQKTSNASDGGKYVDGYVVFQEGINCHKAAYRVNISSDGVVDTTVHWEGSYPQHPFGCDTGIYRRLFDALDASIPAAEKLIIGEISN